MSHMSARRPRIPVAFMPLEWTPETHRDVAFEDDPEATPRGMSFPREEYQEVSDYISLSMSKCFTEDVFLSPMFEQEAIDGGLSESNARKDVQSQFALNPPSVNPNRALSTLVIHPDASPGSVFENVATGITQSPSKLDASQLSAAASLRSARRTLKDHKSAQRSRREQRRNGQRSPSPSPLSQLPSRQQTMHALSTTEHDLYTSRWGRLKLNNPFPPIPTQSQTQTLNPSPSRPPLRFFQIPWPLSAPIIFSPEEITLRGVEGFVLCPWNMPLNESERVMAQLSGRARVEREMERWEEGLFEEFVVQRVREEERNAVRVGGAIVRGILAELLGKVMV